MNLGLVITEKHTKLRGLLVLKQKKGKKREKRRANSNGVGELGGQTCIYKVGRRDFEKKKNLKGDLRRYGKKLREG